MEEKPNKLLVEFIPDQERFYAFIERLYEAARPTAVFSQPVTQGDYTVITASEVTVGVGAGYGGGGGGDAEHGTGSGGGGGGGGSAISRPVAAISVGPDGVRVEPIIDPTKMALALFTVIGAIFMTIGKVRRFQTRQRLDG